MDVQSKEFTWGPNKVVTNFKRESIADMQAIPVAYLERGDTCLVLDVGGGNRKRFTWLNNIWVPDVDAQVDIATYDSLGVVQVGHGLEITADGVLSAITDFTPGGETWVPIPGAPNFGTSGAASGNGCFYFCTQSSSFNQYTCDNGQTSNSGIGYTPPGRSGAFCGGWFLYSALGSLVYWSVQWGGGGTIDGTLPDGSVATTLASDGTVLYASGTGGAGIYKCLNFPDTTLVWTKVADFPADWTAGESPSYMTTGSGFLWAASGQDDKLYRLHLSTGVWGLGESVGLAAGVPIGGLAYGDRILMVLPQTGSILRRSSDDGETWRDSIVPSSDSVYYNGGIAFGNHGFIISPAGGGTTAYASFGTMYNLYPATRTTLGGVKVGDGIDVTSDGTISVPPDPEKYPGFLWTAGTLPAGSWAAGAATDTEAMVISGTSDPGGMQIKRTSDAGKTWVDLFADPGMEYPSHAICIAGTVYAACGSLIWSRSMDDTAPIWTSFSAALPDGSDAFLLFEMSNLLVGISLYGDALYYWEDSTSSWELYTELPADFQGEMRGAGVSMADQAMLMIFSGSYDTAWRYDGNEWTKSTIGIGVQAAAYGNGTIVAMPTYPDESNVGKISLDLGASWRSVAIATTGSASLGRALVYTAGGFIMAMSGVYGEAPYSYYSYLKNYDLQPATEEALGGIKVGEGLGITADGTLSVVPPTGEDAGLTWKFATLSGDFCGAGCAGDADDFYFLTYGLVGGVRLRYSIDGAATWATTVAAPLDKPGALVKAKGRLIACQYLDADGAGKLWTSTDNETWTDQSGVTLPNGGGISVLAWDGTYLYAASPTKAEVYRCPLTSATDAFAWTLYATAPAGLYWATMAVGDGYLYLASDVYDALMIYDGTTWTQVAPGILAKGVAYGDGSLVVFGDGDKARLSRNKGLTFTDVPLPIAADVVFGNTVVYNPKKNGFIAAPKGGSETQAVRSYGVEPWVPTATETVLGTARVATLAEVASGVTSGLSPAFLTPETSAQLVKPKLTANLTVYVRTTGNDGNDGRSVANAFATIDRALDEVQRFDGNGYTAFIGIGVGNFTLQTNFDFSALRTRTGARAFKGYTQITLSGGGLNTVIGSQASNSANLPFLTVQNLDNAVLALQGGFTASGFGVFLFAQGYPKVAPRITIAGNSRLSLPASTITTPLVQLQDGVDLYWSTGSLDVDVPASGITRGQALRISNPGTFLQGWNASMTFTGGPITFSDSYIAVEFGAVARYIVGGISGSNVTATKKFRVEGGGVLNCGTATGDQFPGPAGTTSGGGVVY